MKKIIGRIIVVLLLVLACTGVGTMTVNNYIVNHTKEKIVYAEKTKNPVPDGEKIEKLKAAKGECILVLGAGIKDRETPTEMLQDRLDTAIRLYREGVAPKLLLSGDNGTVMHNEIHVMLNYVRNAGVPEEDIFCDHAGFSTYDSVYRSKSIFGVKKAVIVTQTYHEYRALYIAEKLGIEAIGAASDQEVYAGQPVREIREVLARTKEFFKCMAMPEPLCGGEAIPINGSGVISHGE